MRKKRGFSLVEMVVVVSIICVIVSMVIPVTIGQLRKSTERKFLIEGKVLESAVEIYNTEKITNKINLTDNLLTIKEKLVNGNRKYINSWPEKLKGNINGEEREIDSSELINYKLTDVLNYINDKEKNLY